jgi:hypothetical protein
MLLVPVQCRVCSQIYLESALVVVAGNVPCECGGIARALSGQAYAADDESLFAAVVSSLASSGVSALSAPQLLVALDDRMSVPPGAALHRLSDLRPGLAVIELIAMDDAEMARKAESMFETVLEALASTRTHSDLVPRIDTAPMHRHGGGNH